MEDQKLQASFVLLVLTLVLQHKTATAIGPTGRGPTRYTAMTKRPPTIAVTTERQSTNSSFGTFSSPNYPKPYPQKVKKTWKITAPVGKIIDIYFEDFTLQESTACTRDYLKISNGCNEVPIATYCGYNTKPVRSKSNALCIEFRSDSTIHAKGFRAIYKINSKKSKLLSCPRQSDHQGSINYCLKRGQVYCCDKGVALCRTNVIFTAKSGKITSPGYPKVYSPTTFTWRITAPEGYVVQLNFTSIKTYEKFLCTTSLLNRDCDFVQARDGPCLYNKVVPFKKSKSRHLYPSVITKGRYLFITFRSDSTYKHVGFEAKYRWAKICSGEKPISCVRNGMASCCSRHAKVCLTGTSWRTHCPRDKDPASYTGCCTVDLQPSCCPVLQSSNSLRCPRPFDYPTFIDICTNKNEPVCCNKNLPACNYDKLLTAKQGTITSPGYPLNYPDDLDIVWRITVPHGYLVQLNFITLGIEESAFCPDCTCDYVSVRDGPCSDIVDKKWCGFFKDKYPSFMSTGRHLQVSFKSDHSFSDYGFVAKYRRVLKCHGDKQYSCLKKGELVCCEKKVPLKCGQHEHVCLNKNGEAACCKTQDTCTTSSSTKLWITLVIMTSALLLS